MFHRVMLGLLSDERQQQLLDILSERYRMVVIGIVALALVWLGGCRKNYIEPIAPFVTSFLIAFFHLDADGNVPMVVLIFILLNIFTINQVERVKRGREESRGSNPMLLLALDPGSSDLRDGVENAEIGLERDKANLVSEEGKTATAKRQECQVRDEFQPENTDGGPPSSENLGKSDQKAKRPFSLTVVHCSVLTMLLTLVGHRFVWPYFQSWTNPDTDPEPPPPIPGEEPPGDDTTECWLTNVCHHSRSFAANLHGVEASSSGPGTSMSATAGRGFLLTVLSLLVIQILSKALDVLTGDYSL